MADDKTAITPVDVFAQMVSQSERSAEDITSEIIQRTMNAKTLEEVLGEQKTTPIDGNDEILGRLLLITSFEPREEGKYGWWAVVNAVDVATGEIIDPPLATGGSIVLTQLAKLHLMQAFPVRARFIEKQTRGGYGVLRLVGEEAEVYDGETVEEADYEPATVEEGSYSKKG